MLVRRDGEGLNVLLKRLNKTIALVWSEGIYTDEVNEASQGEHVRAAFQMSRSEPAENAMSVHTESDIVPAATGWAALRIVGAKWRQMSVTTSRSYAAFWGNPPF